MFTITNHKGFQMTFENGWTVSVQWGPGNYCDHYSVFNLETFDKPKDQKFWKSETAEIAAWDKNQVWFKFEHDTVKGHLKADEVAKFISKIARKKA